MRTPFGRFTQFLLLTISTAVLLAPLQANAQSSLPDVVKPPSGINLGSTSFYDGFGRTRPGVTVLEYFRWAHIAEISGATGSENPIFTAPRINAFPDLMQVIVATQWRPFGGTAGFSVLVPLVELQSSFAPDSPKTLSNNGFGVGDIIAGPIWQSKIFDGEGAKDSSPRPASRRNPYFAYRFQFLVQVPNGSFDPTKSLNQGSGYWALAPYIAATFLPVRGLEMSTRLHYQYNLATDKIPNPPPIPHLTYTSGQAGQLLYDNYTTSYRFTRKLYMGANAYGLYQLSPDKTNGVNVGGARETQFYLGPGGGYDFPRSNTLNVNLYLKMEAHNTASGPSLQLLFIHRF
ncbi:MAG: transporter [Acidobacteriaceae bacterium]